jgi:hypothetical protein
MRDHRKRDKGMTGAHLPKFALRSPRLFLRELRKVMGACAIMIPVPPEAAGRNSPLALRGLPIGGTGRD